MIRLSRNIRRLCSIGMIALVCGGMPMDAAFAVWQDESGLTALRNLLGDNTPEGTGIYVSQVEAPTGTCCNNYYPNLTGFPFQSDANYTMPMLVNGSEAEHPTPGNSGHATNVVATNFYSKNGMSPDTNIVVMYEANDFLDNFLNVGSNGYSPVPPEFVDPNDGVTMLRYKVQNHSWAADTGQPEPDNYPSTQALRALARIDNLVEQYELTSIVGVENQGVDPNTLLVNAPRKDHDTLLSHSINSIAMGVSTGWHTIGETDQFGGIFDTWGNGRSKPSMVAPNVGAVGTVSSSTAIASGAAAMLHEQVAGTDAEKSEVIRAIMMAGATKLEFLDYFDQDANSIDPWERTTTQPLDNIFGAGELNVLNNYLIAEAGQFAGSSSSGSPTSVGAHGWDYVDNSDSGSRFYEFEIPEGSLALDFSVMLTWNATINVSSTNFNLGDMELKLWDPNGVLIESSDTPDDNIEHIYIGENQALEYLGPGTYKLEVGRNVSRDFGLAWRTTTAYGTDPNNLILNADFDGSGDVDGRDFLTWQRNQRILVNASLADGDADGDGDVDQTDLSIFEAQYGLSLVPNVVGIPEPSTLLLGALAALGFALPGRRRQAARD